MKITQESYTVILCTEYSLDILSVCHREVGVHLLCDIQDESWKVMLINKKKRTR